MAGHCLRPIMGNQRISRNLFANLDYANLTGRENTIHSGLKGDIMLRRFKFAFAIALLAFFGAAIAEGNLAAFPPEDFYLQIDETEDGKPVIDVEEFHLVTGNYYRFNITSSGETDWRLELPELLANSHLRILTVNDGIEIQLQAMVFRAIEFDEPGKVSFSFVPIRPGTYSFTIGRNPIAQGLAAGTEGVQEEEFRAEGRFIVE